MAFKIYIHKAQFYIEDTTSNLIYEANSKDVLVTKALNSSTEFYIFNIHGWNSSTKIDIVDIQTELGVSYTLTDFITFYEGNTGVITHTSSGVDVNVQDQHSPALIGKMSQLKQQTTLSSATVIDDLVVNVVDATGMLMGETLQVWLRVQILT